VDHFDLMFHQIRPPLRNAYPLYAALETSMISLVFAHKDLEHMQLLLKYFGPNENYILSTPVRCHKPGAISD
jgi:hypothetical protein